MSADLDPVMKEIWHTFSEIREFFRLREAQAHLLGIMGLKRLSEENDDHIVRWHALVADPYDVGEKLNRALKEVENAYPEYRGCFEGLDYTFHSVTDRRQSDRLWLPVINAVSRISFKDLVRDDPRALSSLCMQINDQVSLAERKRGEFDIPENVAGLILTLLRPKEGQSFYDPFCTSGATLLRGIADMQSEEADGWLSLYAETMSREAARLIRLNLFCAGAPYVQVACGDVIQNPGFVNGRYLQTFDRIACFIPWGVQNWGETTARHDPYGRFIYGIPPRSQGDFAYLQHCIASLSDDGVLVAGVTPSMLFKERTEGEIRRRIVEDDLIEAVISLPQKIIPQTGIPFYLLVIRRNKPEERCGKILFVDASKDYMPGRSRNTLRKEDIDAIEKVYYAFEEIEGFSAVCSVKTIAEHDFILEVADYVAQPQMLETDHASFDLEAALAELTDLQGERCRQYDRMITTLTDLMEHGGMD